MGEKPTLSAMLTAAGVCHFTADEITFKGASHHAAGAAHGLNTDPPAAVLPSLVAVARLAEKLRAAYGPLRVISSYRSPAYNRAVGGAPASYHRRGMALDLAPLDGRISSLHRTAWDMHGDTLPGGLGFYPWGVHIDTGPRRSWGRNLS